MSNPETDAARATIAQLEADLAAITERDAALKAERAQLEAALARERAIVAAATAEAQRVAREPADRERLATLTETLRAKLAKAPLRSPTAARVRSSLPRLADETVPVGDRLTLCRRLLDDLAYLVQLDGDRFAAATPPLSGRE